MSGFSITYATATPESAEHGGYTDTGFLVKNVTFRTALDKLYWGRGAHVEADCLPLDRPRWFTFYDTDINDETGETTSYSLHLPCHITPASRMRIARLLGCYGASK